MAKSNWTLVATPAEKAAKAAASAAQLAANRANSQHSTGPVTAAGKEKVSANAKTHGRCERIHWIYYNEN